MTRTRLTRLTLVLVVVCSLVAATTTAQSWEDLLDKLLGDDSEQPAEQQDVPEVEPGEAGLAVKEALLIAADKAVQRGSARDGFWADPGIRIPLPDGLERARNTLRMLGLEREVGDLEVSLNRAAERASGKALPLLRDAVKEATFADPVAVLAAGGTAATDALGAGARESLGVALAPIVASAMDEVGVLGGFRTVAAKSGDLMSLAGVREPDLGPHLTARTVAGLLTLMGAEEVAIRSDPRARTTELVERVFGPLQGSAPSVVPVERETPSGTPASEDTERGLRQALLVGTRRAVARAAQADGYFANQDIRIPLPRTLDKLGDSLRKVGLSTLVEEFELSMNRAAERAAAEATPILVDAVRGVTFEDAMAILTGGDTAATDMLRGKTEGRLTEAFKPIITAKMDEAGVTRSYDRLMEQSGGLAALLIGGEQPDLPTYVTGKALDGLFALIAEEEAKIRKDPVARTTSLLQRVFGWLDRGD